MFRSKNNKSKDITRDLSGFLEDIHTDEDMMDFSIDDVIDNSSKGKLHHILKSYETREEYVKNLIKEFESSSGNSIGLEEQILELFNNVKALLIKEDRDLIKHCIKSISIGRENALRFIEEEKGYIDDRTLNIMNVIVSEYSHHINNLNEAMDILDR